MQELRRAFDGLDEAGKQFMNGYWQALLDQGAMMNADLRSEWAYFKEEMRRRIDLIAADYGVPASEVAKVRGRLKHDDALCFAQKYRISLDWLIGGAERSSRGEHEAPTPITSKA